ncbi:MAG: HAMP domain-containing sensor histidine kinase [Rhodospirillaceae bacterium]
MPLWVGFQSNVRDNAVIGLCTVLTFGIFCFDLITPEDNISVGFYYCTVILLSFFVRYRRLYFSYASVATVLVIIGCFFPMPSAADAPVFLINRAIAVLALWLSAGFIHYRTTTEAALIKSLEVNELASLAKSRFLASMSHELRAPLTGILGFSEILKSEMLGPLGSRRYVEYAGHIHESGEHMLTLINDVLDIAKIEAGRMEIDAEQLDVGTLFEFLLDMTAHRAEQKGLTLQAEEPGVLQLHADVRATKQMMLNLLSNALKFTPKGGGITVSAAALPDGGTVLSVTDTGPGMSHETLSRLLRPFEQADNRFSSASKGTGLGLSLVKGLIELHNGRLAIESQIGRGSTFSLFFPPPPLPAPAASSAIAAARAPAGIALSTTGNS